MDIIILCMNQKERIPEKTENFYVDCLFDENENKCYCSDIYFMLNSIYGGLYSIFSEEAYNNDDLLGGTIDIIDFKEKNNREEYLICDSFDLQFLKENIDYVFDIVYFKNDNRKNEFKKLLQYFIRNSTTQSCVVLFRQGLEIPEKIVGPIDLNTFFEMVESEKIYTNVEYVLRG